MDPVQYLIHLIEQEVSPDDAWAHTKQRFGLSDGELSLRLRIARKDARALVQALERNWGSL